MSKITINIPRLTGMDQSRGEASGLMTCAWDAANMETIGGELKTSAGWAAAFPTITGNPIITALIPFHRRNHASQSDVLVAATADSLWVYNQSWSRVGTGYASGHWDWVIYEDGSGEEPVDILLLSNAADGMVALRGDTLTVSEIATPGKFSVLARYKERIFGAGDPEFPDRIYYSQPFDPASWGQVISSGVLLPDLSGGCLDAPTWDGDGFIALRPFGNSLLAFKSNTVFRIYGADPGEFYLRDQFGTEGPLVEDTVAIYAGEALMMSKDGLSLYDGSCITPFKREELQDFWRGLTVSALSKARAALVGHMYYLSLPYSNANPNRLLALDLMRNTLMVFDGIRPIAMTEWNQMLYFADSNRPGVVYRFGTGTNAGTYSLVCRWITPYCTTDHPEAVKSGFRLSGMIRSTGTGDKLRITLESERGSVSRTVSGTSGTSLRPFSVRLPHYAKRFRLKLENISGSSFAIVGSLRLECTLQQGGLS